MISISFIDILPDDILLLIIIFFLDKTTNINVLNKSYYYVIKNNKLIFVNKLYFSWRSRPDYYKKIIISKKKNIITGFLNSNTENNLFLYAKKTFINWKIYDTYDNPICKIQCKTNLLRKINIYSIKRLDNSIWFQIKILNYDNKPRVSIIYNINSRLYENTMSNENDLIITNTTPDIVTETVNNCNKMHYTLKYTYNKICISSVKNTIFKYNNVNILEFGKISKNKFLLSYKSPFHAILAFSIAIVEIIG
tara:strand:+ start:2397 stop:3149 length:753 start_codon:yes stop_codon:yes gene_type:complete